MNLEGSMATTSFPKAMALLSLGVPPLNVSGRLVGPGDCWEFRLISSSELRENKCETVEDAEEKGVEGQIVYGFAPHPESESISKAFENANKTAWANSSTDIPDVIKVKDVDGKTRNVRACEIIAMGIAFAFRNADKFWPRRTEVRANLFLEKEIGFAILDRRTDEETIEKFTQ